MVLLGGFTIYVIQKRRRIDSRQTRNLKSFNPQFIDNLNRVLIDQN